ncbi:DUF402 domain-containing protein [Mobilitalea sibirica]|uniref:DUF402 domain-containing protein n=1 Tax=Mobilitalea sibirica TaxID=1462919 RepID=A0A8J7KSW0_9FIRM|nr:DUF402 domain-containing protein [Mobilitalea sibirica]MBH1940716.1 DUF402 domain-containing protein [Mobilitalea sibirica]
MKELQLYRRRFIPDELIHLKKDIILVQEEDLIITKWNKLHPREDISRGYSAFYLDQGFKISKIYDNDNKLVYWYCDIIQYKKEMDTNSLIIEDLLIDVLVYEDGTVRILDLDELADAMDLHLITEKESKNALRTLDTLLKIIYQGRFGILQEPVNNAELMDYSSNI